MNDGTRDIGNTQELVLLFRGLDPLSGSQVIKARVTLASFGFAFVGFIDAQVMQGGVVYQWFFWSKFHPVCGFSSGRSHVPSDSPVGLSNFQQTCSGFFAHQYPFQQVDHMLQDETAIPSSINLGGVEGAFVKYWDDSAMVAILEFKVEARPQPQVQASTGPTKEKKGKKKKGAPADCSFLAPTNREIHR
jgi:RNA-binding protein 5/10